MIKQTPEKLFQLANYNRSISPHQDHPMHFSPSNLRLSSPLSSKNTMFKDPDTIDQDYLYNRLNALLFTLQTEKDQFEEKTATDKKLLEQKIALQDEKIQELQTKNQKLEQESRQLRFNYHQRGSVVDYLKKKVNILETKFEQQKQEMLSVIKYLESRNYQLNEIIFQLKQKQVSLNQNLYSLQQKYFNLTNELCFKNLNQTSHLKVQVKKPLQRKSLCHKPSNEPLTPLTMTIKHRHDRLPGSNLESSLQIHSRTLEDSTIESLGDSTIREKTVKIESAINRVKSQDNIDFSQLKNYINLGGNKIGSKNSEVQHLPSQGILINNYGHLSFTDFQGQNRTNGIRKSAIGTKPKHNFQPHGHGRYVTQLQSKRASKQGTSSHEI